MRPHMGMGFNISIFSIILDRYHYEERLSDAAEAFESIPGVPPRRRAHEATEKLEGGKAVAVVGELKHAWDESGPNNDNRTGREQRG